VPATRIGNPKIATYTSQSRTRDYTAPRREHRRRERRHAHRRPSRSRDRRLRGRHERPTGRVLARSDVWLMNTRRAGPAPDIHRAQLAEARSGLSRE
jgi:hypothetical protein